MTEELLIRSKMVSNFAEIRMSGFECQIMLWLSTLGFFKNGN